MLVASQINEFRRIGHLTVEGVFDGVRVQQALDDIDIWTEEFLGMLPADQRDWYLEKTAKGEPALRKLDHPVFYRPLFRELATDAKLIAMVQQIIGDDLQIFFSQVFLKPPEVGGAKPIHQDNFYFGPDDPDAALTAWIALDRATQENGCLFYGDLLPDVLPHEAPAAEPFNLQIRADQAAQLQMTPAPVSPGGVSFHHGNTPHQSGINSSRNPRRAVAIHYLRRDARLVCPALPYDSQLSVEVTS